MATTEKVTIGETEFTARRLTVKQILDIMDANAASQEQAPEGETEEQKEKRRQKTEKANRELNVIGMLFEDCLDPRAFYASLQVRYKDICHLDPEEIQELMEAVGKANPTYAGMEKRLKEQLLKIKEQLRKFQTDLSGPASA